MESHTYEKIEAYLTKRLTDSERITFEKTLSEDSDLKETVVKMQLLRKIAERNLTRTKITSIHSAKTTEWKQAVQPEVEPITEEKSELPDSEETAYEEEIYEDELPRRSWWLPVLWLLLLLVAVVAAAFIYMAKSPIAIRENNSPVAATTQRDSTQQVYLAIYNDGVQALQSENYLAAISYFDQAINSQKLPNYHTDAARFLESVAYASQQPNKANKRLNTVTKEDKFAYPYTNMDKLQVQCKILWAKLMGWKG